MPAATSCQAEAFLQLDFMAQKFFGLTSAFSENKMSVSAKQKEGQSWTQAVVAIYRVEVVSAPMMAPEFTRCFASSFIG